ncbi:hypothetical protein KY359_02755, partial [Candidatus Woesearchaeota archaeon]|nr:hypothetical protein [Candidatus Woesearchaeota archaeon]
VEEEEAVEEPLLEVDEATEEEAGTTPDSFMWQLDKAMEQLDLLLTFDESEEALKEIEIAKERLAEVKVMLSENNLEDAEAAQEAHDEILADVEDTIEELSESDAEEELAAVEEIEGALAEHEEEVAALGEHISVSVKGQLSEEHQAQLNEMLMGFNDSTAKVQATVKAKKNRVRVKVKLVEEKEGGGKTVTVQHTDLMKTNQGQKNKASGAESEEGDDAGEGAAEESAEKTKGKPEKEAKPEKSKGKK